MKKVFEVEKPITNGEYWVYENADTHTPCVLHWDNDRFVNTIGLSIRSPVYWAEITIDDHADKPPIGLTPPDKPPIGLTPRKTHNWQRAQDIMAALTRYVAQSKPIPKEWLDELSDLCGEE